MDLFEGLHKALGKPEMRVEPPESFFAGSEAASDEDLLALWGQDGWARYGHGLFWTVDPRAFSGLSEDWPIVPHEALVFGRSAFGNLYLVCKDEVLRLDVQWNRLAKLGPSTYVFLNSTIKQPRFQKVTLQGELFGLVRERLGDLAADECYGLFPALPLGGNDEDPTSYRRVKLLEYLALLAQAHA
jgi:hypothetical protein